MTAGLYIDHAKAVRIPLLIILFATVLTLWVDQIQELFLLLMTADDRWHRLSVLIMTAALGFAVWHTARTVYRFNIPTIPTLSDPRAEGLRTWVPRLLGSAVPLLMALCSYTVLRDPSLKNAYEPVFSWMPALFLAEGIALFVFVMLRRSLFAGVTRLARTPGQDPRVNRWSQLPLSVRVTYMVIVIANLVALVLASRTPKFLPGMGALALVLMCASFLTVTGTYLTIQASRWQFPLLIALFGLAMLLQLLGSNDNHRIRLCAQMHSTGSLSDCRAEINKSRTTPSFMDAHSYIEYVNEWSAGPSATPVYLVSAEGGGIRAAAWTGLVLAELERESGGEFSKHMLFGSGVSGGSLGLAWFAAVVKGERAGLINQTDIVPMAQRFYETDFLSPTVQTMFLTDFLQRFVPWRMFVDRGERLELSWEDGWMAACRNRPSAHGITAGDPDLAVCSQFSSPWKDLWSANDRVPTLFLNSTEVQSGRRFIEQPFGSIRGPHEDDNVVNAATLSTHWLPPSAPLSAVVHNSARFTYVSPAGTLLDISATKGTPTIQRQLVDGGYFDNSGMTTLAELLLVTAAHIPGCTGPADLGSNQCPIRIIHISNDPAVETLRSDDRCNTASDITPNPAYGEIRAPVMAIMNTREARGAVARAAVRSLFTHGTVLKSETDNVTDAFVFHFRLCKGTHHLPLGWTLSDEAMHEMRTQLLGGPDAPGEFNRNQLRAITGQLRH